MALRSHRRIDVTRTHLELRGPESLRPARAPSEAVELVRVAPISAAEYRALYTLVGEQWLWRDRLVWTDPELDAYLGAPSIYIWRLDCGHCTAGYFELQVRPDIGSVEIMYFGLVPAYMGRGFGGWLLTRAVEEAFALGAHRVMLNTCTLDAPQALPNYLARGFTIVREEQYQVEVGVRPPDSVATA